MRAIALKSRTYQLILWIASINSNEREQEKTVTLIYRGQTYEYTRSHIRNKPQPFASNGKEKGKTATLIYRGLTYESTIDPLPSYRSPRAINWRFQTSNS